MLCMYWYCIFRSRECREREPFICNSKVFSWSHDSLKWEDSIEIILIIAWKSRTWTLGIAALREWIRKMHFAQPRNLQRKKGWEGAALQTASTGTCLPESLSPRRFQLDEVSSSIWHASNTLAPQVRQGPLADPGGTAVPPEAFTFRDSHYLKHSLPDLGRSGACTEPFTSACYPCPASGHHVC